MNTSEVKKFTYNTMIIFRIYLITYFSQPKRIETYLVIFLEIIQRIFHCNFSESENLAPTKLYVGLNMSPAKHVT